MTAIYHVYIYRDPREGKNNAPVYVGIGKGDRAWQHLRRATNKGFGNLINLCRTLGLDIQPEIVASDITKLAAIEMEVALIAEFGRRDLKSGTLFNRTKGGEGTAEFSEEALAARNAKIAKAHSTPEARESHRERTLAMWQTSAGDALREKMVAYSTSDVGRQRMKDAWTVKGGHSEESKRKIGEASRKLHTDPVYKAEWLKKQRAACKTDQAKANKSEATKAGWANEETRQKRIAGIRASHQSDEYRANVSAKQAALWTDEAKKRASDFAKMRLKDPVIRVRSSVGNAHSLAVRKGIPFSPVSFHNKIPLTPAKT